MWFKNLFATSENNTFKDKYYIKIFVIINQSNFSFLQERNNLTNLSTFKYSGLVHKKTLGIIPATDKKGFTVVYKKRKYQVIMIYFIHILIFKNKIIIYILFTQNRPVKNTTKVTLKHGARRSLGKLKNILKHGNYRSDLRQVSIL